MKKRIFALAAVAALALSAAACNAESSLGQGFSEEDAAMHEQYTQGYMIDVPGEDGEIVTHFYACDAENTIASYGFNVATAAEGTAINMAVSDTGVVEMKEDGTFTIADKDGMVGAVYKAEFMEDGTLTLTVDTMEEMNLTSVGAEAVVEMMVENAGFHMVTE